MSVVELPCNGITLSVHRFGADAPAAGAKVVLLLHGFMDAGGTWSRVATAIAAEGHVVFAPDLRGFGRSSRVAPGGYYHFPDYVADVAALVPQILCGHDALVLVGHSMGGTVASLYAAARPDRVERLVLIEGIGPPDMAPAIGLTRFRTWLDQLDKQRKDPHLPTLDEALRRLAVAHSGVDRSLLADVAQHLLIETRDGGYRWAVDPLHRTTSPTIFRDDQFAAFLEQIACPVLFVSGGESGWHPPEERARLQRFPAPPAELVLEGGGHMLHWTRPAEIAGAIARFAAAAGGEN
jgi:pimeloyl-ACP methyl ester carboxylesterase